MRLATLATCSLNQWALDFDGNLARTRESVLEAKQRGATYRIGPELELTGYGCEDHFLEDDTIEHAWESLASLLADPAMHGILIDVGLPVLHFGVRYNCRAFLLDGRILLLRPKLCLADDGNYREARYFSTWKRGSLIEQHNLPSCVQSVLGQSHCPFGNAILALADSTLAAESCEELFTPEAPHIALALAGVDVFANGSGSHHQLRKLDQRMELIRGATRGPGGIYLYSNQRGCDGGRLYFDGCACVVANGELVAQARLPVPPGAYGSHLRSHWSHYRAVPVLTGAQFALADVEVVTAVVDLDSVVSHRGAFKSMQEQMSLAPPFARIDVSHYRLCHAPSGTHGIFPNRSAPPRYHRPEEEIALGPACWLWDYLRRSGASGYLLPLSGGADSSATAAIVGSMCALAAAAAASGDKRVAADIDRLMGRPAGAAGAAGEASQGATAPPQPLVSGRDLAQRIFTTVYLGSENSSGETRARAAQLSEEIGARHLEVGIDKAVAAVLAVFVAATGRTPRFKLDGGGAAENLALQNIQARLRMVFAFLFAQLLPWTRSQPGFLLVLGSANVDEALRGYMTKYDCSAADVNPIGGISKRDLKAFLVWAADALGYPTLAAVERAPPTAELEPRRDGHEQTDEEDMGMSYSDLNVFGVLRKVYRCGPLSMFRRLLRDWPLEKGNSEGNTGPGGRRELSAAAVAEKVKCFFSFYAMNRHKMTTLTPSYHAENYSPDDNRFDLRQFLYNVRWPRQFAAIDKEAAEAAAAAAAAAAPAEAGAGQ